MEINFASELKRLRTFAGISTKTLSTKVGKAVTYVSQIENGKIKNPDYSTCYALMKEIGMDVNEIEGFLDYFGIIAPEREHANIKHQIQLSSEVIDNWLAKRHQQVVNDLEQVHAMLLKLSQFDITNVEKFATNMKRLTIEDEGIDFLLSLFSNDFSYLDAKDKKTLLRQINNFVQTKAMDKFCSEDE